MPIYILKEVIQIDENSATTNILKASTNMPSLIKLVDKYTLLAKKYNDKIDKGRKLTEKLVEKSTENSLQSWSEYIELVDNLSIKNRSLYDMRNWQKYNVKYYVEEVKNNSPIFVISERSYRNSGLH